MVGEPGKGEHGSAVQGWWQEVSGEQGATRRLMGKWGA